MSHRISHSQVLRLSGISVMRKYFCLLHMLKPYSSSAYLPAQRSANFLFVNGQIVNISGFVQAIAQLCYCSTKATTDNT